MTGLGSTSATLNGTVTPEDAATTYQFEYGPTTAYGTMAPATASSAGSGSTAVPASTTLAGLAPEATYHYALVATNAAGTTTTPDGTFTTPTT